MKIRTYDAWTRAADVGRQSTSVQFKLENYAQQHGYAAVLYPTGCGVEVVRLHDGKLSRREPSAPPGTKKEAALGARPQHREFNDDGL